MDKNLITVERSDSKVRSHIMPCSKNTMQLQTEDCYCEHKCEQRGDGNLNLALKAPITTEADNTF